MKLCPSCKNKYPDDGNFCPREECAGEQGPRRLEPIVEEPLARFVAVSRLGGGQSGEVWQSSDAQSGAAVAYKIVAAEVLPTAAAFERAQRELRQLQRASNPHIVKIIDFGKTAEGRLFVASELASGEPLDQVVLRSGPFGIDRAKKVAAQIGEALLEAQKVGVVHRDLSAKNVLVSGDDQVRVINFAIPRPCVNNLFGVPEFMSPEQADGKLIDQRSNTYSLGALLYLMLTGHAPHAGATPQAIVDAVQKAEITPPSIKRGSGLTTEVDRIILKALERNSSRRPLTMRQFLTDVSGLIVNEAPAASSATAGGGRDGGFARTMMFAGGATEVQKLVAQAIAARQAVGNGAPEAGAAAAAGLPIAEEVPAPELTSPTIAVPGTPSPMLPQREVADASSAVSSMASSGEVGPGATPAPMTRPSHGAAIAATMIAMPAARGAIPGSSATGSIPGGIPAGSPPASRAIDPSHTPPLGAASGTDAAGANFRETLWFKKGDVDQMVADARAKVAAMAGAKKAAAAAEPELPAEDAKPLEDRYVDDGTVSTEDRKKFSLRGGSAPTALPSRGGKVPGERMSENEMLGEIGGGKRLLIIGVVGAVVVVLVAVVLLSMKGGGTEKNGSPDQPKQSESVAPNEKAPPATAPAGLPSQAAEKPAAEKRAAEKLAPEKPAAENPVAEKKPAAETTGEPDEKPQPAAKPSSARKKAAAKKKAAGKKKR